jgi:hypothetical protein
VVTAVVSKPVAKNTSGSSTSRARRDRLVDAVDDVDRAPSACASASERALPARGPCRRRSRSGRPAARARPPRRLRADR